MKNLLQYILLALLMCTGFVALSQTDQELAEYYYDQGEYEKAKLYYDKIYKTDRTNAVYTNYLNVLIALEDFEEAEKMVKKKLRARNDQATAHVDLGSLYKQFNRLEEAQSEFSDALKELDPGKSNAIRLANSFIRLNEYQWALETYKRAQKISSDGYEYHFELANLQGMMGNLDAMVESYMDLLLVSPNYIQTVQNSMNRNLNVQENEENAEMLRTTLIKRVQRYPDESIYAELLIWMFNQKKDFASSMVQAKALDKRLGENGFRLMDIGQMALVNEDFETAEQAFAYVAAKGPSSEYFISARTDLLQAKQSRLDLNPASPRVEYENLAEKYRSTLKDIGRQASTAVLMKDLAHILAFRLQQNAEAIQLLEDAIELPGSYARVQAICKLELGDILLLQGDIWDASLLYSQVELSYKEDPLGHEAKFRNAKISYYTGDFEWAQAQLDVLKASTSKLISNDAIDLSLLITDNFAMDTTMVPMLMFAQADLLAYQNRMDEAILKMDSITTMFPGHALADEILMLKSDMAYKRADFEKSTEYLNEILSLHFKDILADDALFKLAEINENVLDNKEKASELYQQLLTDYPGSLYVVEARKRFRALRGDSNLPG
jgi:tetratricopeptide (TPR) repeat protein